jgi:hypothetical protein
MTDQGADPSVCGTRARWPSCADFVEKVEKSSGTKTRQIAIRWNIAAQQHLRPVEDLARCAIDKLAGPPADFLNAAPTIPCLSLRSNLRAIETNRRRKTEAFLFVCRELEAGGIEIGRAVRADVGIWLCVHPQFSEPRIACLGNGQGSLLAAHEVASFKQMLEDGAWDSASEVKSPFSPVEAKSKPLGTAWFRNHKDANSLHPTCAGPGQRNRVTANPDVVAPDEGIRQRDAQASGHVVIATAGGHEMRRPRSAGNGSVAPWASHCD